MDVDLETRDVDLDKLDQLQKAFMGVDVVVNMAANSSPLASFSDLVGSNIVGTYNVFEAARLAGCKRVVWMSSVHAIKGYPLDYHVKEDDVPKPANIYGVTKVFGEALCRLFSSTYNLSCIVIRSGAYVASASTEKACFERDRYEYVITQRDMAQLIHKSILAADTLKFAILAGISRNKVRNMDLEEARKLVGYEPEDDFFAICERVKKKS